MMFADPTKNTRRRLRALGWFGCLLLVMAVVGVSHQNLYGAPAVYYTATTGNDSNPGTSSAPFRTLGRGVSVLNPGDTLLVAPGTYVESLVGNIPSGTSWTAPVTLKALNPAVRPVIRPSSGGLLHFQGQQYIVVDGFILDATAATSENVIKITIGGGQPAAHHIRIANSEVKNARRSGILTTNGAGNNEFINLDVHDNGVDYLDHGLYIGTHDNLIENCRIYNNAAYGVHVYSGTANTVSRNIVRNNHIYNNAQLGVGNGIILSSGAGNQAYNNVVRGNDAGIQVAYGSPTNTLIYNNTVYANDGIAIQIQGDSTGAVIRNNIVYLNTTNSISNSGTGTVASNNLVGTDPDFVNGGTFDFHVQSVSPAVDGGMTLTTVPTDFDGTARPQGVRHDIGAYEYKTLVSGAPAAPTNLRIVP